MSRGIVTVCASISYPDLMIVTCRALLCDGWQVHAPTPFGPVLDAEQAALLAREHREWIDMSDAVCPVRKPDGSYGESVRAEIDYAQSRGIPLILAPSVVITTDLP